MSNTDMNDDNRQLSVHEIDAVSGGMEVQIGNVSSALQNADGDGGFMQKLINMTLTMSRQQNARKDSGRPV